MKANYIFFFVSFSFILSCSQKKADHKAQLDQIVMDSVFYLDSSSYALINSIINAEKNDQIRVYDSIPQVNNTYKFLLNEQSFKTLKSPPELIRNEENLKVYRFDSTELPNAKILPANSIDFNKPYQENKSLDPFWIVYSPIISKNGKTAAISIDNICFGVCGEGWTLLLKKEDGEWIVIERFDRWIG